MSTLKVYSPYDAHLIQEIPLQTEKDAERIMATAYKTFQRGVDRLPIYERIAILEKFLSILRTRKEAYAKTAAEEGGKPLMDSLVEAERAIQGVQIAIETIPQMVGREIPMGLTASSKNRWAFTRREPVGVVLAISAFNHPLNLIIHQVIPAIAVGCPVIVKPASTTPLSCLNVVNALYEAGLPKEECQVIVCENSIAEKMVSDPRVSFLSFIGSSKVGWHLRSIIAPGAHCALEHGGVAPVLIEADADIDEAIPLLIKGGFYHAGQVCVSVQRIFVQEALSEKVSERITAMAKKLIVGDPLDPKTEVGPLIKKTEVERVDEWVQEAKAKGGKILCGGQKISETCYAPTVILNPPQTVRVSQEEIFGPVVCIYSYTHRDDAIALANSVPYAFQASIFTKNIDAALDAIKRLEAKTVLVNDHTAFRVDWMPFGGRKKSGLGVGGIPYAMQDLTHEKLMVFKSSML